MNIIVKDMNTTPVLYLYRAMNLDCLSYADYPKIHYFYGENEKDVKEQLSEMLREVDELDELDGYDFERVWADGLWGGQVILRQ